MDITVSQPEKEPPFKDAYATYKQEKAIILARVTCLLAFTLVPLFAVLDYFVNPEYLKEIATIRIVCCALTIVLFFVSFTSRGRDYAFVIELTVFLIVGISISLIIRLVGGYESPYYAGLNLVFLGIAILFPWGIRESLILCSAIYSSYIIPIILYDSLGNFGILVNNNLFLLSTIAIALTSNYFTSRMHFREFLARYNLEQARDELKKLHTLKNEFFSRVSHELRTPLTNIILPTENALATLGDQLHPQNLDEKRTILRNAYKLLKRINEILDIAKLEAGKMTLKVTSRDVNSILEDIVAASSVAAKETGIGLVFEPDAQLPEIYLDTDKIEKVFTNLISNALKFTDRGGKVMVKTTDAGKSIEVSVSDTGIGISPENLSYIFDRFRQVDGTHARRYEGTGLGLCIVKEFVQLHHGSVAVESQLGEGTTFTVNLFKGTDHYEGHEFQKKDGPRTTGVLVERRCRERRKADRRKRDRRQMTEEDRDSIDMLQVQLSDLLHGIEYCDEPGAGEAEAAEKEKSILVAEDNRDLASNIARSLACYYNVFVVYNGQKALHRVQQNMPDLIISDVMMPEMDGHELCEKLKSDERTQHIPIVLLTAKATVDDKIKGLKYGADQYLAKPFNPNELHAVVDSLLTKRELQAELNKSNHELKEAFRKLEEAQVQLVHTARLETAGQLAAGVAHEIKNNIYCLRAGLDGIDKRLAMLAQGKLDIRETYEILTRVSQRNKKATENCLFIVNSLLDFSRKDREGKAFSDLNKGIGDTLTMVLPMIQDKVTLYKEYGQISKVECRIEEINQVIMNMVINAYQSIQPKGKVWIKTSQKGDAVMVTIADDGPGIPEEYLPKIFTPFFSTKKNENSGLGLSICYNIIKAHHGTLNVKSTPGQGTELTITLPTRQPK